jgi:protein TonB
MVSHDERYFYLGGFMSLGMFLLTIILFASVLFNHQKITSYAMNKDDYISVSIAVPLQKRSRNHTETPALISKSAPASQPKAETPQVTEDVSTLFDNVWTQDVTSKKVSKKTPTDTKRLSAIEKRIKTAKSEKSTEATEKIKSLKLARPSVAVVGSSASTAKEVNKYYAKIQAIIYDHFYPPVNSEGNSAKIHLELDGMGRVTAHRVLANSGNTLFDDEVDALMKRLGSVSFPKTPSGKPLDIQIILTAEE